MSETTAAEAKPESKHSSVADQVFYWWDRVGILLILVLLVLMMAIFAKNFVSWENFFNVLRSISINAILAAGMTLVILTAGIDLSVGSTLALSGCVGVLLHLAGMPLPVAVGGGIVIGALVGALSGGFIALLAMPPFIVTLGAMTYVRGFAYTSTGGLPVIASDLSYECFGNCYVSVVPTPVILMLIVYLLIWFLLERTKFGRHVYAVGGNPEAARLAGISVRRVLIWVYTIAGATAGLAGIIFSARVMSAQPNGGQSYEMDAITAVVLGGTALAGGRGRITGTLIGAIIIGVLSNGLVLMNVPTFTQMIVKGFVIILAVAIDSIRGLVNSR
ncbi:MAG: ribose ABC transporter permease [Propionibacteriaceae bacterium]|jgi:ribose transport system permease protein|nr:ribose ABC transporter permease [Propionibacteriaceae bacterium]